MRKNQDPQDWIRTYFETQRKTMRATFVIGLLGGFTAGVLIAIAAFNLTRLA